MVGGVFCLTSMAVAGKEISLQIDTFEILFFRSVIGVSIILFFLIKKDLLREINLKEIKTHLKRNIAHFTGQNLWLYSLASITLAEVTSLEFTMPIYISPPTKVKKLGVVRSVIANIFTETGDVTNLNDLVFDVTTAESTQYINARYGVLLFKSNNNQPYDYDLTIVDDDEAVNALGLEDKEVKSKTVIINGRKIKDKPLKYLYGTRCTLYIIKIPIKTIATCLIKFDKIKLFPKFEIALYTGKNENIANSNTIDQIILSPLIFSKNNFIIIF